MRDRPVSTYPRIRVFERAAFADTRIRGYFGTLRRVKPVSTSHATGGYRGYFLPRHRLFVQREHPYMQGGLN